MPGNLEENECCVGERGIRDGVLKREVLHFLISVPQGREGTAWKISEKKILIFPLSQ